jgi:uncharacterized membrane protein (UPF0127 family)
MKNNFSQRWFWVGIGSVAIVLSCFVLGASLFSQRNGQYPDGVYIGEQLYTLEYALTQDERSRGLGEREALCATCAMAFPFKVPGKHAFWMQGMRFSLDIVWIAGDGRVVHIQRHIAPESQEVYQPEVPATLVLEFNAGALDAVVVGDTLRFSPPLPEGALF